MRKSTVSLRAGFTLLELIIVMVIISILAVIVSSTFVTSTRRGRDSRRKNDLRAVANALESYYNDHGQYPPDPVAGLYNGLMNGCGSTNLQGCPWGGQFQDSTGTLYMVLIPKDPLPSQTYYYLSTGKSYELYAHLENVYDEGDGVDQSGFTNPATHSTYQCGVTKSIPCTYVLTSTDLNLMPTPTP